MSLKECFKKNAILFQYVYSTLFWKYFCRIDDYGVKSKLAFEVAHAGYQNQQENLRFVQLQKTPALTVNVKQKPIEEEIVNDTTATVVIESSKLPKQKKRKVVTEKKHNEKNVKLLNELEVNDLHMKCIKSNVNK